MTRARERRGVHHLEVAAAHAAEAVQVVVVPAARRRAADVPRRAVVGQQHPVALQRLQHDARLRAEARGVEARAQPHAQPHRRQRRVVRARGEVARRVHVRAPRLRRGEPQRVVDVAAAHLLVAREARQDRQPGGVGRSPARRAQAVGAQAPDRARAGAPAPAAAHRIGGVQLVQPAAVAVDDDHVAVAVRRAAALDGRLARDRVAPAVGLVRVVERDGHPLLAPAHGRERDADRPRRRTGRTPKSACTGAASPMLRTSRAESLATGSPSTRWFHGLSRGNTVHAGAPFGGWPPASAPAAARNAAATSRDRRDRIARG